MLGVQLKTHPRSMLLLLARIKGSFPRFITRALKVLLALSHPEVSRLRKTLLRLCLISVIQPSQATLWIDAVCIDQKNAKEKGKQVSRMAEIYKSSIRVLVWLGPEMSASSAVIEFLNELSCQISVDWATLKISSRPGAVKDRREMMDSFYNSENLVDGLFQLLTRPWFKRLWVWQEIRAKDNALVMCSYDRILWQDLRSATYALSGYGERTNLFGPLSFLQNMADTNVGVSLEICTGLTWRCICTDPRDRIFALKSLLKRSESDAIKPDYEKSASEVYRDVMVEYALNVGKLHLLRLCNLSTKLEGSPSWVPNWSNPQENTGYGQKLLR